MKNLKRVFLLALLAIGLFSACKDDKKANTTTTVTEPVKSAAELAAEEATSRAAALETARLDSIAGATAAAEQAAKLKAEAAATAAAAKKAVKKPVSAPKVVAKPKPKPKPAVPAAPPADINTQGEATAIGGLGGLGGDRQLGNAENANVLKRPGRDNVLTVYEQKPVYPGGDKAMGTFLSKNIKYPSRAKEDGIKGTVYVKFVVEKDGTVDDVVVSKGVHPLLDAEAARVVSAMPKWAAGKQAGQAVATQYTLPVRFQLVD